VRVKPRFANRLCARLETEQATTTSISGLLFGSVQSGTVVLHEFRCLNGTEVASIESGEQSVEDAVARLMQDSRKDPILIKWSFVGWFAFRSTGRLRVQDHALLQYQFPEASSLAVIVHRGDAGLMRFEFYTASAQSTSSESEYGWCGSAQFSPANAAVATVDVAFVHRADRTRSPGSDAGARSAIRRDRGLLVVPPLLYGREEPLRPEPPPQPQVYKRRNLPWLWMTAFFALAAAITFALLLWPSTPPSVSTSVVKAPEPATPALYLRAETEGDRILLSWDRQNQIAEHAADANLLIDDGTAHRKIHLDTQQVSNGAVLYRPVSRDVSFRLEIHGQNGATAAETLHILDRGNGVPQPLDLSSTVLPKNSPAVADTQPQHLWQPAPAVRASAPAKPEATPTRANVAPATVPEEIPEKTPVLQAQNVGARQMFDVSGLGAPVAAPPKSTTPETATAAAAKEPETAAVRQPATPKGEVVPTPAAHDSQPISQPTPTRIPEAPSAPMKYVSPRPIRQVLPDISRLPTLLTMTAHEVDVVVSIDNTGHVTATRVEIRGPKPATAVLMAAETAAKQWVFEPARLDGRPVPSEHNIAFHFGGR
jgi:hypothetical protein